MPSRQRSKDRRAEQKLIETALSVVDNLSLSIDLIGHAAGLAAPCGGQGTLFVTFNRVFGLTGHLIEAISALAWSST